LQAVQWLLFGQIAMETSGESSVLVGLLGVTASTEA